MGYVYENVELVRFENNCKSLPIFMSKKVGSVAKIPDPHNWNMQRTMGFSMILRVVCDHGLNVFSQASISVAILIYYRKKISNLDTPMS